MKRNQPNRSKNMRTRKENIWWLLAQVIIHTAGAIAWVAKGMLNNCTVGD